MLKTDGTEFRSVVKGQNFITPVVNGYYISGNYICELSHGNFLGDVLYGVTVVNGVTMQPDHDKSTSFNSRVEATDYIESLGRL